MALSECAARIGRTIRLPGNGLRRELSRHTLEIGVRGLAVETIEHSLQTLFRRKSVICQTSDHEKRDRE
jgi:hypothetical protein